MKVFPRANALVVLAVIAAIAGVAAARLPSPKPPGNP